MNFPLNCVIFRGHHRIESQGCLNENTLSWGRGWGGVTQNRSCSRTHRRIERIFDTKVLAMGCLIVLKAMVIDLFSLHFPCYGLMKVSYAALPQYPRRASSNMQVVDCPYPYFRPLYEKRRSSVILIWTLPQV